MIANLLDTLSQYLINIIDGSDTVARFRIVDVLSENTTDNTLCQRLDNAVAFFDGLDFDTADIIVTNADFFSITSHDCSQTLL